MLYLSGEDVAALMDFPAVIEAVEGAYRQLGIGEATDLPRENVGAPSLRGDLKSMPAAGPGGLGGVLYSGGWGRRAPDEGQMLTVVFDDDGRLACLIESDRLSWLRTGATSAVATDWCARGDASTLGVVGAGKQARAQLLAVATVRELSAARVYSPTEGHREAFANEMGDAIGLKVEPTATARDAVEGCAVVCTATTSPEPVLDGDWLDSGTHVNAIGAHYPDQREIDTRTVQRSRVVVDSLDRARKEEGELLLPRDEGAFDWADAVELGAIVAGDVPGRHDDGEITCFTSGGLSIEYLSVGRAVYDRATAEGVGTPLPVRKGF